MLGRSLAYFECWKNWEDMGEWRKELGLNAFGVNVDGRG